MTNKQLWQLKNYTGKKCNHSLGRWLSKTDSLQVLHGFLSAVIWDTHIFENMRVFCTSFASRLFLIAPVFVWSYIMP